MTANCVSQAVRLSDRQVSRPEGRLHALTDPDGPAVLLFDNVESDHGMSLRMARTERRTSTNRRHLALGNRASFIVRPSQKPAQVLDVDPEDEAEAPAVEDFGRAPTASPNPVGRLLLPCCLALMGDVSALS
jgi:hypothetical protein